MTVAWGGAVLFVTSLGFFLYSYAVRFGAGAAHGKRLRPIVIDVALFSVFALHHSLFARTPFKAWVRRIVPPVLERSLYTAIASVLFIVVCWSWQPVDGVLYRLEPPWRWLAFAVQLTGILFTQLGARALDVLDLAGVRQVLRARTAHTPLTTSGVYGIVRHPLYFGWALLVCGAPTMTATRAVFAIVSTMYCAVAIPWEERGLVETFGSAYEEYPEGRGGRCSRCGSQGSRSSPANGCNTQAFGSGRVHRPGLQAGFDEHDRLLRRDLELALAPLAHHHVVEADHVIAELAEHRAVPLIRAGRQPLLLGSKRPADLILVPVTALAAGERRRLALRFFVEEIPLVEGHSRMITQIGPFSPGAGRPTLRVRYTRCPMLPRFATAALLALLTSAAAAFPAADHLPLPVEGAIQQVTAAELRRTITALASDDMAGRGLGHAGNQQAEQYIASAFRDANVPPAASRLPPAG